MAVSIFSSSVFASVALSPFPREHFSGGFPSPVNPSPSSCWETLHVSSTAPAFSEQRGRRSLPLLLLSFTSSAPIKLHFLCSICLILLSISSLHCGSFAEPLVPELIQFSAFLLLHLSEPYVLLFLFFQEQLSLLFSSFPSSQPIFSSRMAAICTCFFFMAISLFFEMEQDAQ